MKPRIAVLDYGSGNIRSGVRALERAGAQAIVSSDPTVIAATDGLLVPGVGAFAACINGLEQIGGKKIIHEFLDSGKPVLGICVGMQILFSSGIEHGEYAAGLDFFSGQVNKIQADILPHMGWNTINIPVNSRLFVGLSPTDRFYFVHSYGVRLIDRPAQADEVITTASYGENFIAAIEKGNLSATQFHPEKSGNSGIKVMSNWLATV